MRQRRTFKVWEEGGHGPCFVLEITSRSTRKQDLGEKMSTYRDDLRVPEYFLFDLSRDWIDAGLRGYRLEGSGYRQLDPGPDGRLHSEQLGLELAVEGRRLRFYRADAAERLLTPRERAEHEKERAQLERERAEHEEARAQLEKERAQLEKERAEREKERAEREKERAEREKERADREKERAERAEAELARLRAELDRLRGQGG